MDAKASPFLPRYSFDSACKDVNQDLIYDPISKQLCIRSSPPKSNGKLSKREEEEVCSFEDEDEKEKSCSSSSTDCCSNEISLEKLSDNVSLSSLNSTFQKSQQQHQSKYSFLQNILSKLSLSTLANGCEEAKEDTLSLSSLSSGNSGKDSSPAIGTRPVNLPPKTETEERKHLAEFNEIVKQAKRKQLKELKVRKHILTKQIQQEDSVRNAIRAWTRDILPFWETSYFTRKTRELWWNGIPSPIRPKVWSLAIGNDLNITEELFRICIERSKEKIWTKQFLSRRSSNPTLASQIDSKIHRRSFSSTTRPSKAEECAKVEDEEDRNESVGFLIKLDVSRTFPHLGLFQECGPYHQSLSDILSAYVVYRPDLGYCQGMSFLAAMLLLNLDSPSAAFIAFANLLNNELLLAFYRLNQPAMATVYAYYDRQLETLYPRLARHLSTVGLTTDLFFVYQIYTLFSRSLPLDCVCRVWDLFLRDGNEFLFRASLALLAMYHDQLLEMEFIDLAQFLSQLPDEMDINQYFHFISTVKLAPPKLSKSITSCGGKRNS